MCYHIKFGRSVSKGVHIDKRNWEVLAPTPLQSGRGLEICPSSTRVTLLSLVILDQMIRALLRRPTCKIWPLTSRLSRPLKVIGTDTDQSATCDFVLTFHSYYGPILYHFRDNWQFWSKIANFSTPVYLTPLLCGFSWNWVIPDVVKKLEWWGYAKKNLTISLAI